MKDEVALIIDRIENLEKRLDRIEGKLNGTYRK